MSGLIARNKLIINKKGSRTNFVVLIHKKIYATFYYYLFLCGNPLGLPPTDGYVRLEPTKKRTTSRVLEAGHTLSRLRLLVGLVTGRGVVCEWSTMCTSAGVTGGLTYHPQDFAYGRRR